MNEPRQEVTKKKSKIKVRFCSYHGEAWLHACTNSLNLSRGEWDVVPVEIHNTRILS